MCLDSCLCVLFSSHPPRATKSIHIEAIALFPLKDAAPTSKVPIPGKWASPAPAPTQTLLASAGPAAGLVRVSCEQRTASVHSRMVTQTHDQSKADIVMDSDGQDQLEALDCAPIFTGSGMKLESFEGE